MEYFSTRPARRQRRGGRQQLQIKGGAHADPGLKPQRAAVDLRDDVVDEGQADAGAPPPVGHPRKEPRPPLLGNAGARVADGDADRIDRKSTRLNSSHVKISYAVFCLKKKTEDI